MSRYLVVGNPIAHSRSPQIHARFAQDAGIAIQYDQCLAPLDGFASTMLDFFTQGGMGANITLPFKTEALALAHTASYRAKAAGAANALRCQRQSDGTFQIQAENFDGLGLVRDMQQHQACVLQGKNILICGAGGATKGVLLPLVDQQPASITIVNRTVHKVHELIASQQPYLSHKTVVIQGGGYDELQTLNSNSNNHKGYDIVINATSMGLQNQATPLPLDVLAPHALAYDMVYGQEKTPFMQWANQKPTVQICDGWGMLLEQAALSFHWWFGIMPNTSELRLTR